MTLPRTLLLCCVAAPLLAVSAAPAQKGKDAKPGDVMIEKYLAAETDRLSQRVLDGATTLEEWQKKRPRLYREYMDMLGLWPLPEKTPLKATVTGTLEHEGVVIENLHFQSKPGLYVTANLYRPKNAKGKLPAVLYVCGHSGKGRDGNKTAFQDHGMWFATNGYVCILLDTLQLGEIPGVHHGTYGRPWIHSKAYGIKDRDKLENRWWWQAAGYAPSAVECWNGVRAIDYLVNRPDVDADKIAVTGISGGGAATFWIAAADERVKCAVPVSGMSDLQSYVKDKVINGHCDCMFLINTYGWEWTTIAALVAPRPLLFANSDKDRIFPMDGNRRIIERLRKLYKMYGKPELVDEYVSEGGHDYRPDLRVAVFKFINKHIKNDTTTPVEDSAKFKPLPGKVLRVFPTDADIPKDAINQKIDETFVPQAEVKLPEKGRFPEWKKALLGKLRATSFRSWPDDIKPATRKMGHGDVSASLETEPGIEVWQMMIPGNKEAKGDIPALVVIGSVDKRELVWSDYVRMPSGIGFTPRGVVNGQWTTKSPPNYVERSHALLGRTVDQQRVYDILSWLRYHKTTPEKEPPRPVLVGRGQAGILAAYAALFEPWVGEVVIIDPPKSHKEGPTFLNVLRVLDIPEALGLLAPDVRLTLINARDPAFDRTEQIYKLAGAADKLTRK
ncbi:MAG: prolyl oligopeptidase family serine peptidase [Gemmataceae bacterium]|nr:prolyl oligopeptidase family serine peptidase [Gemmataceae bacterium]